MDGMQHRVKLEPVKVRTYDRALRCETVSVVAYRLVCSCGARGRARGSVRDARAQELSHAG